MTPSQADINAFKAFTQQYSQPQGRDWYSNEISNIAQAFANSKGYGGDSGYVGSLAGMAYPGTYFQQPPADLFPEGQDNGDGFGGGLLGLAALAAGAYFGMPSFSDLFSGLGAAGAGEAAAGSMLFPGEAVIGTAGNAYGGSLLGGGGMFNPFTDYNSDYFSGASNYLGGGDAVIPSSYGANGYPTTGIYSGGPTSINPLNYLQPTPVTWDGIAQSSTGFGVPSGAWQGLMSAFGGGGSAVGAGLGALAGALGANQKPAGTVTSVQDIPDYLKPYQAMNLASGTANFAGAGMGANLLPGAQNQLQKTINGDYLNPNSNPAFQPYVKDLMGQAGSQFASLYGKSPDNLNNSGFQEGYTRAITNAVLPLYNSAYQTERGNQLNAASTAPGFASNYAGAALAPNLAFKNLYSGAQANTQPYFTNPMGGALSGGLAGYALGNSIFGGK